jgi:AcrR family transcriptional regulator
MSPAPEGTGTSATAWRARRVLTYEQAHRRAIKVFVRDGGLDMKTLADELPVGRATLYRVVGSRDRLLGDVLWTLAERTLETVERQATAEVGLDRVFEISHRFKEDLLTFEPLRRFLATEPEVALRVLLTPAGGVSERMVKAWAGILRRSLVAPDSTLPFDLDWFAYVLVRTGESMLYSDLLAGREPDLELADLVTKLLFRAA